MAQPWVDLEEIKQRLELPDVLRTLGVPAELFTQKGDKGTEHIRVKICSKDLVRFTDGVMKGHSEDQNYSNAIYGPKDSESQPAKRE